MRRKKHKITSRIVRFYKISYGFREPFKVFLDGNFIHNVVILKQKSLQEHVQDLLGGKVRLFTTRCVMAEMESMGPELKESIAAAKTLALAKCGHEESPVSATECLRSLVGDSNHEHYWVATQDRALRAALQDIAGAPSLLLTPHGLTLETPSDLHKGVAEKQQKAARSVSEHEKKSASLQEALKPRATKVSIGKKPKKPNPLSCKKKAPRPQMGRQPSSSKEGKRRRKKKSANAQES